MRRLVEFTRRHPDAVAALALLFLPLAILGHALMPGKVMSPADLLVASFLWAGEAEAGAPKNGLLADITYLFHPSLIYAAKRDPCRTFPNLEPPRICGGAVLRQSSDRPTLPASRARVPPPAHHRADADLNPKILRGRPGDVLVPPPTFGLDFLGIHRFTDSYRLNSPRHGLIVSLLATLVVGALAFLPKSCYNG